MSKEAGLNLTDPPQLSLWMAVPDRCPMRSDFEIGDDRRSDIQVVLGSPGECVSLVFERQALERFLALAQRMLAVPDPQDSAGPPRTALESSYEDGIRAISAVVA